jgi:succinyl-CoA synthetase beta subunit
MQNFEEADWPFQKEDTARRIEGSGPEVSVEIIERALAEDRSNLSEYESKQLLTAYGIPVTREVEIAAREALEEAIKEIGFPMVLKGCGPKLIHKTERNLVHLDVRSREEAVAAFDKIMNEVDQEGGKVLVQEMVRGPRELVAGLNRDVQFGPCVMFGLGGILTEILKDVSFRVAPLQKRDALQMIQEIKARNILGKVRGLPPADLDALAGILINLGRIGMEEQKVLEIDINPLVIAGSQPIAVDALVVLGGAA